MHAKSTGVLASGLLVLAIASATSAAADAQAKPKVTFQDQVAADLPEPVQHLPQRRQAEGRA